MPAETAPDEGVPAGAGDGGGSLVRYHDNLNGQIIWMEAHPHGMAYVPAVRPIPTWGVAMPTSPCSRQPARNHRDSFGRWPIAAPHAPYPGRGRSARALLVTPSSGEPLLEQSRLRQQRDAHVTTVYAVVHLSCQEVYEYLNLFGLPRNLRAEWNMVWDQDGAAAREQPASRDDPMGADPRLDQQRQHQLEAHDRPRG